MFPTSCTRYISAQDLGSALKGLQVSSRSCFCPMVALESNPSDATYTLTCPAYQDSSHARRLPSPHQSTPKQAFCVLIDPSRLPLCGPCQPAPSFWDPARCCPGQDPCWYKQAWKHTCSRCGPPSYPVSTSAFASALRRLFCSIFATSQLPDIRLEWPVEKKSLSAAFGLAMSVGQNFLRNVSSIFSSWPRGNNECVPPSMDESSSIETTRYSAGKRN